MKKMIVVTMLFVLIVLTTACTVVLTPTIEMTVPNENPIQKTDVFKMTFNVLNPQSTTFVGNITYQYNKQCLFLIGTNTYDSKFPTESIKVPPKEVQSGKTVVIKTFEYIDKDNRQRTTDTQCLQTPLKISIFLYDASGKLMDAKGTTITIV
jgi:hypothetical protein